MHASRISRRAWIATLASTLPVLATAQAPYPDRPITLVVPNAAGGAADNLARSVADELGKRLKQSVVVENLGGASGAIAAQKVLHAAPDGYTLLFGTTSDMVVTPIANRAAGYAAKDFTPIGKVGTTPMTLVARPNLGVSTADQMAALAKQKPNGLSIGTTGNASLQAFAAVALQRAAGIDLLGVPYKRRARTAEMQRVGRRAAGHGSAGRPDRSGRADAARGTDPCARGQAGHAGCAVAAARGSRTGAAHHQ